MEYPRIVPAGDSAVVVEFGNEISEEINGMVSSFSQILIEGVASGEMKGIREATPTFRSVLVAYNPRELRYNAVVALIKYQLDKIKVGVRDAKRVIEIPVCYGGIYGPDLNFVAEHAGLKPWEVIDIHTSRDYLIYMLGFQPGFPYLGGLDPRIFTPRLEQPRVQIPAGSVGIGGEQTGLYPIASPAGWQIIGTTPVKCYNTARKPAIPYMAGDYIHFYSISEAEYQEIELLEEKNAFEFRIHN